MDDDDPIVLEDEPATLSSDDVANLFGYTRSAVYKMVRDGALNPFQTPGGMFRFRPRDVERVRRERAGQYKRGRKSFWELP